MINNKLRGQNKHNYYIFISFISFISSFLYSLNKILIEIKGVYLKAGIVPFIVVVFIYVVLLSVFYIAYLVIFTLIDSIIVKEVLWLFMKGKFDPKEFEMKKNEFVNDTFTSIYFAFFIALLNILLWVTAKETIISIIYPLDLNEIIKETLRDPHLLDPYLLRE